MMGFAFCLIYSSIILVIVLERETQVKHQQVVSGTSLFAYWFSEYLVGLLKCMIPTGVGIAMIYVLNVNLPYGWLFMIVFQFSVLPFTYVTSFIFDKEAIA
jgi:ATP-binding cassette subfamily A (ABC1) protein 3